MGRYPASDVLIGVLAVAVIIGWIPLLVLAAVFNSLLIGIAGFLWLIVLVIVGTKLPWRD